MTTYYLKDQKIETDSELGVIRSVNDAYEWVRAYDQNPQLDTFLWYSIERGANGEMVNLISGSHKMHTGRYASIVEAIYHNRRTFNDPIRTNLRTA